MYTLFHNVCVGVVGTLYCSIAVATGIIGVSVIGFYFNTGIAIPTE